MQESSVIEEKAGRGESQTLSRDENAHPGQLVQRAPDAQIQTPRIDAANGKEMPPRRSSTRTNLSQGVQSPRNHGQIGSEASETEQDQEQLIGKQLEKIEQEHRELQDMQTMSE